MKEKKVLKLSKKNKAFRVIWKIIWSLLYRPSPTCMFFWRCFLLKIFGAKITGKNIHPYPSSKVWAPWNLIMEEGSCLGHHVDCYNVEIVHLCESVTVSQYSFLCTASHDYTKECMPLIAAPIKIKKNAWITADVFIGPGVTIGEGAVVSARSTIIKDINPWEVVAGNPARVINIRKIDNNS